METNELIEALVADRRRPGASLTAVWWGAAGLAVVLAACVFCVALGPRPDMAAAAETPRFIFKFGVAIALAFAALSLAQRLSSPGAPWRTSMLCLAAVPALLAAAVMVELVALPPDIWLAKLIGTNSLVCLTYIPLIGVGPLAIFLLVLRYGAPTRPGLAGAAAGLLAGGIAAAFYAAQCIDDSPLFVATWYPIAISGLAAVGAVAGKRMVRW